MVDGGPRHVGLGHLVNIHGGSGHLEHIWDRAVISDYIMGHMQDTPGAGPLTMLGWVQPPPPPASLLAARCLSISCTSLSMSKLTMENTEMELAELRLLSDLFLFF